MNYYNEFDPKAAAWLRELIKAGHIPDGYVDERSITDVKASDLTGYTQCHFFAGIGGWSYALRLADWPADRPIWTGSCPCQPFSQANSWKKEGRDPRDLWHVFFRLIRECNPPIVLGEQVASPDGLKWLDTVCLDLEDQGYAAGAADLCAAGVGAPHIRQRLYWVAIAGRERLERERLRLQSRGPQQARIEAGRGGQAGLVGDSDGEGSQGRGERRVGPDELLARTASVVGHVAHAKRSGTDAGRAAAESRGSPEAQGAGAPAESGRRGSAGTWDCEWVPCRDGKMRPIESQSFPLAHGVPGRVGLLRGYGNAIVPQVAATFIKAVMP